MEDIFLIHIHVDHLISVLGIFRQEVLDRIDIVINVVLGAIQITSHSTHPVIHGDNIGIEAVDQVVQRTQRGDHPTGRHVHIYSKSGDTIIRVRLWIGMYRHMALIQVSNDRLWQRPRRFFVPVSSNGWCFMLSNQHGHAGTLRLIILAGYIQNVGANDFGYVGENLGETLRVIQLVNIFDIFLTVLFCLCVSDIKNIKTQGFGQVIKTVNRNLGIGIFHHSRTLWAFHRHVKTNTPPQPLRLPCLQHPHRCRQSPAWPVHCITKTPAGHLSLQ